MSDLLTVPEAAARLRISRATLYRLVKKGAIRVVKLGRLTRVSVSEVERAVRGGEA